LAQAQALLDEGGRPGAVLALDAMAAASTGDRPALRRIGDLRLILNEIAPRTDRSDTATRMHYR